MLKNEGPFSGLVLKLLTLVGIATLVLVLEKHEKRIHYRWNYKDADKRK
jgi:hypothetical protein